MENQNNDEVRKNSLTLHSMCRHHGNQCLKFHLLPFLSVEETTNMRSTCQTIKTNIPPTLVQSDVKYVVSTAMMCQQFAALKTNGSVILWGSSDFGGDYLYRVSVDLQSDVKEIVSTAGVFGALKNNGNVIVWGDTDGQITFDNPNDDDTWNVPAPDQSGFIQICSDLCSIVSTKSDGTSFTHTFWHDNRDYYERINLW